MASQDAASPGQASRPRLEICIDSLDAALTAAEHMRPGDRFEVCSSLIYGGGLTPSLGLITSLRTRLPQFPLMAMVRPRSGGFTYTEPEVEVMLADIAGFKAAGVAGVVFGCLTPEGEVDVATTRRLVQAAAPLDVTFHRAFDTTSDWERALRDIESISGITRILTSGHAMTALDGVYQIAAMSKASKLSILPGSGVNAATLPRLLDMAPVPEVHLTAGSRVEPEPSPLLDEGEVLGFGRDEWRLDGAKLAAVREVIDSM